MRKMVLLGVLMMVALPASASQPGEPLGAEDLVLLLPGLTTSTVLQRGACPTTSPASCSLVSNGPVFGADGYQYNFRSETMSLPCTPPGGAFRWFITRLDPAGGQQDVAYIETRCALPQGPADYAQFHSLRFDLRIQEFM
jgi:hypothetical protein